MFASIVMRLKQITRSSRQPRDRAKFLLMRRSGPRVQEVAGLRLKDCDLRRRQLTVRQGKNWREWIAYLSADTTAAL
jgi:site-specific recombinase XerD